MAGEAALSRLMQLPPAHWQVNHWLTSRPAKEKEQDTIRTTLLAVVAALGLNATPVLVADQASNSGYSGADRWRRH
jgi:hypothetical protein